MDGLHSFWGSVWLNHDDTLKVEEGSLKEKYL